MYRTRWCKVTTNNNVEGVCVNFHNFIEKITPQSRGRRFIFRISGISNNFLKKLILSKITNSKYTSSACSKWKSSRLKAVIK